ncbi:hypothetical protein ACU4GD_29870 [Cupriavidus basilensis]
MLDRRLRLASEELGHRPSPPSSAEERTNGRPAQRMDRRAPGTRARWLRPDADV